MSMLPLSLEELIEEKCCVKLEEYPYVPSDADDNINSSIYQSDYFEKELCLEESDFNRSHSPVSVKHNPCRPNSAKSNATSVTLVSTDMELEHLRSSLSSMQADNDRLKSLNSSLCQQLHIKTKCQKLPNVFLDKYQCLTDELEASQRKIRMNEEDLERSAKFCHEKDKEILDLKMHLFEIQQEQSNTSDMITSLGMENKRILQELQTKSQEWKEKEVYLAQTYIKKQQKLQNELQTAFKDKASYIQALNSEREENMKLNANLRETENKLRSLENKNIFQQKEVTRMLDEAQRKIKSLVEEVSATCSQNMKLCDETALLQTTCSDLKTQVSQLENQAKNETFKVNKSGEENASLKETNKQLQRKNLALLANIEKLQGSLNEKMKPSCNASPLNESMIEIGVQTETFLELEMEPGCRELYIKQLEGQLATQLKDLEKYEGMLFELQEIKKNTENNDERSKLHESMLLSLKNERNILQQKVNDFEELFQKQQNECESLEERLKERTTIISEKQITFSTLIEENSSLKCDLGKLNEQNVSLKNNLSQTMEENKTAHKKIKDLEESLLEKERRIDECIESVSKQELAYRLNIKQIQCRHSEQIDDFTAQIHMVQKEKDQGKKHAASLSEEVFRLKSLLEDAILKEQLCDNKARSLQIELEGKNKDQEETLTFLQDKVKASSLEVKSLEDALAKCKSDIELYVDRLHSSQNNFQEVLSIKNAQVKEMKLKLQLQESSNSKMSIQQNEIGKALHEKQEMLEAAATKILESEDCQKNLQSKVFNLEQQLLQKDATSKCMLQEMDDKLQIAYHQLDQKHKEKMEKEFNECNRNLACNKVHLEKTIQEKEEALQSYEKLKFEWKEMKTKLDIKIEHVVCLEEKLKSLEQQLIKAGQKCLNVETQLEDSQSFTSKVNAENKELLMSTESLKQDVIQKQHLIESLQGTVSTCQNDLKCKTEELKRLDRTLEERQSQLKQRAEQLSQIQGQVYEFRNHSEKCNSVLNIQLQSTQSELNERNKLIAEFDKRISCMGDEVAELRHQLIQERQNVTIVNQNLQRSEAQLQDVTKELNEVTNANEANRRQCLELSLELETSGERERTISKAYQECLGNVERCNEQIEKLLGRVDELTEHGKNKDQRINQLTKQLLAVQTCKSKEDDAFRQELETSKKKLGEMREQYNDEVQTLKTSNTKLTQKIASLIADQEAVGVESKLAENCRSLTERVVDLERELLSQKRVIEAANDAIIIKDSEIARCNARMSGLDRIAASSTTANEIMTNGSILLRANESINKSDGAESNCYPPPHVNINSTATSLFADMDAEIASFVPITAASTYNMSEIDSFFVTSSPTVNHRSPDVPEKEEISLHQRVFDDRPVLLSTPETDVFDRNRTNNCGSLGTNERVLDLQRKMKESENRRRCISSKLKQLDHDPA